MLRPVSATWSRHRHSVICPLPSEGPANGKKGIGTRENVVNQYCVVRQHISTAPQAEPACRYLQRAELVDSLVLELKPHGWPTAAGKNTNKKPRIDTISVEGVILTLLRCPGLLHLQHPALECQVQRSPPLPHLEGVQVNFSQCGQHCGVQIPISCDNLSCLSRPGQGAHEQLVKHIIFELQAVQCRWQCNAGLSRFMLRTAQDYRSA